MFSFIVSILVQVATLRTNSSSLFISYVRPHKPVSSKTLARWVTWVLDEGGVDTNQWAQHSVRGASATHHRVTRGLTVNQLSKLADWSLTSGTYKRFYERYC